MKRYILPILPRKKHKCPTLYLEKLSLFLTLEACRVEIMTETQKMKETETFKKN
jgi:hypothetical protein